MSDYPNRTDWTNQKLLPDRSYLTPIMFAIYVMRSASDPELYRSGVIGIQQQNNNAYERLSQLNKGDLKHLGPWHFAFLAPLPADLGTTLKRAEDQLQTALSTQFESGRRGLFRSAKPEDVLEVASRATAEFLRDASCDHTDELQRALTTYCARIECGEARDNETRADVLTALRRCLNGEVAKALLTALESHEISARQRLS